MKSLKSNHACPLELGFSADDIFFSVNEMYDMVLFFFRVFSVWVTGQTDP